MNQKMFSILRVVVSLLLVLVGGFVIGVAYYSEREVVQELPKGGVIGVVNGENLSIFIDNEENTICYALGKHALSCKKIDRGVE